jgi:hypothetical protein
MLQFRFIKKMVNKNLLIISGVIIVLIVGVVVFGMFGKSDNVSIQKNDGSSDIGDCNQVCATEECKLSCEAAVITNIAASGTGCESLSSDKRAECEDALYLNKALESKDGSYCDKMSTVEKIPGCKDTVILMISLSTNNKGLCSQIVDSKTKEMCLGA